MIPLELHAQHASLGARFSGEQGMEIVGDYGDAMLEYRRLRDAVAVVDLSHRGRLCLTGNDRVRLLHGQVTNDVQSLALGQGCQAALVTAKGRFQCDLSIYALEDELLLDFEPGLTDGLVQRFDRYIVADDVQVINVAPHYALMSLQGPKVWDLLTQLNGVAPVKAITPTFVKWVHPEWGDVYLMNRDRCGEWGIDIYIPIAAQDVAWETLRQAAETLGGGVSGLTALNWRRIEAGIPRFGMDLDESNLPPEAGSDYVQRAIHYGKGCYIGQEIIARIRTYGQVTKSLRGMFLEGDIDKLPVRGQKIVLDGKERGYITSAIYSPTLKRPIALGFVRKECHTVGTRLKLAETLADTTLEIVSLPFVPPNRTLS